MAQFKLGALYLREGSKNEEKARGWIVKSVQNDRSLADLWMPIVRDLEEEYSIGELVPEVHEVIFKDVLNSELVSPNVRKKCDLALFYKEGRGVEKNQELAYLWAVLSVEDASNYSKKQAKDDKERVGECNKNFAEIKAELSPEKVAELNKRKKAFLEENLIKGQVIKDRNREASFKKTFERLLKSAENEGHYNKNELAKSQKLLSDHYRDGKIGLPKSNQESFKWLKRSVGNWARPHIMRDLALRYKDGVGVEESVEEAYYWALLAFSVTETGKYSKT